jgi:serine/threonine protein kinase
MWFGRRPNWRNGGEEFDLAYRADREEGEPASQSEGRLGRKDEQVCFASRFALKSNLFFWNGGNWHSTRTSFMGTPEYMCPEMIMVKSKQEASAPTLSYGASCDWWACGILLCGALYTRCIISPCVNTAINSFGMYEMLCGYTPFVAKSVPDIFTRVPRFSIVLVIFL